MPQEPQQITPKTGFEAQTAPFEPLTFIPHAEAVEAHSGPKEAHKPPLNRVLIGATFLTISILGGMGLVAAYLPKLTVETPEAQAAAAAASQRAEFFKSLDITAKAAYVYDAKTDTELFAKNPTAQLPLASITKVMLVLAAAEVLPLNSTVTISREAVEKGGGGLTWGEEWNVRDLIDFTLITSSNTGAEALAEAANPLLAAKYPDGSQLNATIWRMNALAAEIGLHETYFINASGLDESATQAGAQSSPRDIAALFAYALRTNKELFTGTAHTDLLLGPTNFPERDAHNTNNALADIKGLIMGKTGTTDLAGGNLAIVFDAEENHPIIVVVLNSTPEGRYVDIKKLAEAARKAVAN